MPAFSLTWLVLLIPLVYKTGVTIDIHLDDTSHSSTFYILLFMA